MEVNSTQLALKLAARKVLYQFDLILAQFEGVNLTLTALKISHLEQLNSKIFA
ncbi:hypothetical protein PPEP_a2698 [Pseudoalteromonas peptidolytica F12-50-A1]|uniref:Uncharacterized protein n=1 Tax=Pseudoalteromonas peptidolytica F12-50-A1 TaxID=1315280 RepID=A0A8I0MT97_9GAMM|nr:hypothetical protein [Pseudoalteromonas peptidolytica F12-50-A1]